MADPDVQGSNPVKTKNNFASIMLTEIISLISKHDFDLELLESHNQHIDIKFHLTQRHLTLNYCEDHCFQVNMLI